MLTKVNAKELKRIAEAHIDLPEASPERLAQLLGMDEQVIEEVLEDPIFQELVKLHKESKFSLWAGIIAKEQEELSKIVSRLGYDAILRLKQLIYSVDEKVAGAAIRTALEYNSELERPVVRHEITTRFTQEEIDKARDVVRKLKMPALPVPPDGPPN